MTRACRPIDGEINHILDPDRGFADGCQRLGNLFDEDRSVSIAGITSTRRMRETGEKKCVPRKQLPRPSLRAPLRDEMEIEDVFDARPAVGAVIAPRR
jgi:hypothetical protein